MSKALAINQEEFENFLEWLSPDREEAGQKYEIIRFKLIKIFHVRGVSEAEELADETINRVIKKAPDLIESYRGDPALYCYGVAKNILREYFRKKITVEIPTQLKVSEEPDDSAYECLEKCMKQLNPDQRQMILKYYSGEKQQKIQIRKKLEQELKISNESLRIRVFRIRKQLQECVKRCLSHN